MPRVLIYVQHLMGVGHVFRIMRIAEALLVKGLKVHIAYGGERFQSLQSYGADIHFLPPIRAGEGGFGQLTDSNGCPVSETYKDSRRDLLLDIFNRICPDVLITETFPFGRWQMHFELIPLMELAKRRRQKILIISSIRDILQEDINIERNRYTVDLINTFFDAVLVHGDDNLVRLEHTFPLANQIKEKIRYTGIVAQPIGPQHRRNSRYDVVVSVGGGVQGRDLLLSAAASKEISSLRNSRWCFIAGLRFNGDALEELAKLNQKNIFIENFSDNFSQFISDSEVSLSRAGYNTVSDVLSLGKRAVIVPLSFRSEMEQIRRAEILASEHLVETVKHDEATPEAIAFAIDRVIAKPVPDRSHLNIRGAENSARIVSKMVSGES